MAAELQLEWISALPSSWTYGVTRDGRIFFINEEANSTTWLHPVSGEAVSTGHRKTPDLPTGWEEGFTFEGARCFINHNERKVTCKHPVSDLPSQDNCIFVVNEQTASKVPANEQKERPISTMSEAYNNTPISDCAANSNSPAGRPSRPSKKIHNFGKRSNSIRRNPSAPVIKRNWLYKQDSTGMKLWKKRWFVLSDLCLFYYRDEKEEGILGSILLPSFQISLLSVDDHINRKFAFKATHPNMRTYYFCTDTEKEMESWMKVMTDAANVHSGPTKRLEKLKGQDCGPKEISQVANHKLPLTQPEIQNNERNLQVARERCAAETPNTQDNERKLRDAERYGFQKDGAEREHPLTKINSIKLQPAQAAAIKANVTSPQTPNEPARTLHSPQVNGSGEPCKANGTGVPVQQSPTSEPERNLSRTSSMQQLEQWVRTQRGRSQDDDARSITSYQTLPRNMPSHRVPYMPHYGENYRSMPRNSMAQRDSICSMSPSLYDQTLGPSTTEKRRSMRDDTMWQLYEWQQRQAYSRQSGLYSNMASPKTMINLSEHAALSRSIPPSPSHGSLSMYGAYSPMRSYNMANARSEVASPIYRRDLSIDRRQRPQINKYAYPPDRRSLPAGIPVQTITAQSLQSKTPEELTLLLIKLRRQQAELNSIRDHTVAQLMQLNMDHNNPKNDILSHHLQRNLMYLDNQMKEIDPLIVMTHTLIENSAPRPQVYQQMNPEDYREQVYTYMPEVEDIDSIISRLCEQDKVVKMQEEKLQQLLREKHTLETALLSASQEIELGSENPAALQGVIQQRDLLQSGLLSTCRELSRVTAELERSGREYERLEAEVIIAKNNLLQQLEALGSPQTEPPSQQHVRIQKELWRIQDVMEALDKQKAQRIAADGTGFYGSDSKFSKHMNEEEDSAPPRPPLPHSYEPNSPVVPPLPTTHSGPRPSSLHRPDDRKANQRNSSQSGPDYRLYKSEPELTTVAEVDENNGEDRSEHPSDREHAGNKGMSYPVGIVPPRTKSPVPESSSIASYVTLRKSKKPDPRTERPRSAVEQQLCAVEGSRPRMSVEEQLERIRRHQQGTLREKKKSLSFRGGSLDNTPSRSHSFTRENHFHSMKSQIRRRDEVMSSDIQDLEASLRHHDLVKEQETPAEEIARLKESSQDDHFNLDRELSVPDKVLIPERYIESDPEEPLSPEQEADKRRKVDRIKALIAKNSMANVLPSLALSPEDVNEEEVTVQEKEKMINMSYELAAEASKRSKLVAVKSLSSSSPPPQSPNTPPQLTDGSHFMCV
ncbi:pleckstrin homology domain-containing family A member 5-like isoform X3 [Girardinichthys multiradiatus]|uniref:pleckstrin homology domain-containing family A member 5-like isoform X3 n=1 Tax=Girardinichthys multiradiatus TaxID=208333 RepID=UPI001FAC96BB|nr:pleckstrin homology domain-containing family A member 5-like isoform X3 [Girardinichthys multiradiatus]XP_047240896.1 pleckstrin homology domain-containing family A member 5-like isoform X3 [Girardinichthys multiradiatus]XP_047240902.1 pleckstrin homology domain-containing family A member 5-like isoform X3 [Girardinichthys multiradiatus]XP_047240910.1 pleckstrin homology domain-containing family A member 5-like isoform X3 [Girardinichthys multiradiatus]